MQKYILLFIAIAFGCSESARENARKDMLPKARGEADEIIIVVDSTQWADTVLLGAELRKTFMSPMLGLPQDESLFQVSKVNPQRLNSVLKSAKNMVFVMTLDSKTPDSRVLQQYFTDQSLNQIKRDTTIFMRTQRDLFAKGQTVMFLFSATEKKLAQQINYNRSQIREYFESSARETIKEQLFASPKMELANRIEENHNVRLTIPYGWEKARDLKNFVWLRKMDAETEQSIFIYYEPYTDQGVFNEIGEFRDKITRRNLYDGENPDVAIERQPQIPVFTERVNFNGHFAVEGRGLWRISDMSRGGPFVSYTIVDEAEGLIYYVEGYVDSPGTRKKNLIRELEAILSTFKTKGDISGSKEPS
ncbi:MAG: DUF4837 family protein [Ekhidna sp.]|uniref:DUF4837 family protein n=1 Tax=Ekhidna sp. TaxID=2608089 RepID=UPI0032EF6413